jgi:hypothetical protein
MTFIETEFFHDKKQNIFFMKNAHSILLARIRGDIH